jgi:hypothetical protein
VADDEEEVRTVTQEITQTYDCKVPGCTEPAKTNRGKNAFLCDRHIRERPVSRKRTASAEVNGYLGKVAELTGAARRLDRAQVKLEAAQAEFDQAKGAWNQAVDALDLGFVEIERKPHS